MGTQLITLDEVFTTAERAYLRMSMEIAERIAYLSNAPRKLPTHLEGVKWTLVKKIQVQARCLPPMVVGFRLLVSEKLRTPLILEKATIKHVEIIEIDRSEERIIGLELEVEWPDGPPYI